MMNKPRKFTSRERATVYRRYNDMEKSVRMASVYKTISAKNISHFWIFDKDELAFSVLPNTITPAEEAVVNVTAGSVYFYLDTYFKYDPVSDDWGTVEKPTGDSLAVTYGNIARYQLNRYYADKTFQFERKSAIEGSTTQYIKGAIMPLENGTIQYYSDSVNLTIDDLLVIKNRLYSVESVTIDHKHFPRDFFIYTATINSII